MNSPLRAWTAEVHRVAKNQGGVVSRRQLHSLGIERWRTKGEVRAGRWRIHHLQTVAIHTGPLQDLARWWSAVFEAGTRGVLDGVSALIAAGLKGYSADHIRVSVPRGAKILRSPGVVVRQTRRLRPTDIVTGGVPRVRPEIAAVRAALWARSNRQAALILAMVVQQGLAPASEIGRALLDVRKDKRRRYIESVLLDILDGAQSMGELDFTRLCRRRGLPEPDRQVKRRGRSGTYYLDVHWVEYGLVLEIDGIQHAWAANVVSDALRQNDVMIDGDMVLRLPLLGMRVAEEEFFAQIEAALSKGGWKRSKAV